MYWYAIPFSIWAAVQFHRTIQKDRSGHIPTLSVRLVYFLPSNAASTFRFEVLHSNVKSAHICATGLNEMRR